MNDFELESKLKSVQLPERSQDYWENFPSQVRFNLRRVAEIAPRKTFLPRLAYGGAMAFGVLIFALMILPAFQTIAKNERSFRREMAELPHQLHVLMADEHGMHYLIAEQQ